VLAEGYLAMDYDDFGRIMRLLRYDGKGRVIDSLAYQYLNNTGRLGHVRDGVGSAVSGNDVDNQMPNNYAYDASGNLVSDVQSGISGMRYNADNRLLGFVRNGQNWQYRYDGSGNRVEKVEPNGSVLSYRRGGDGELLATYKNSGEVEKFFVGEEGEGIVSGGNEVSWRYYIRDMVGNVVGVVDRQGNVVGRSRYDAWGYEDTPRGKDGSQFERKFLGNSVDEESGMYDMGARPYDARLGRFVNPEPLYHDLTGISPYSYSFNQPLKFIDKSGFKPDVAISVDPRGAGGNGHTTLYFQNKQGQWFAFDQGANETPSSGGNFGFISGSNTRAGVTINPIEKPPVGSILIKTSKEQDGKVTESAEKIAQEHNSGEKKYNLYSNNCTDAAVDVLERAGISIENSSTTVKPNSWITEVKSQTISETANPNSTNTIAPTDNTRTMIYSLN
jgi:RHS repeat-associated protein